MTFENAKFQHVLIICSILQTLGISVFYYNSIEYSILSFINYGIISYWFYYNTLLQKSRSKNFILIANIFLVIFPLLNFNSYDFRIIQVADVGMILILICFAIYHLKINVKNEFKFDARYVFFFVLFPILFYYFEVLPLTKELKLRVVCGMFVLVMLILFFLIEMKFSINEKIKLRFNISSLVLMIGVASFCFHFFGDGPLFVRYVFIYSTILYELIIMQSFIIVLKKEEK